MIAPSLSDAEATYEDIAPSREELLKRAAELGPSRMTWESIVLSPTDPILGEKMKPRVRERRARFRKIVKVALGMCVAFCVFVIGASVMSSNSAQASSSSPSPTLGKTVPAACEVPVEKLSIATNARAATGHVTAAVKLPAAKTWASKRH
jgi:hypothetical protein